MKSPRTDIEGTKDVDQAEVNRVRENEVRALLRQLVMDAVPRVPRKLNRVGELYSLYLQVAKHNQWTMTEAGERITLLRLVILQLLAPDLYRFGRQQPAFMRRLEEWAGLGTGIRMNLDLLEKEHRDKNKADKDALETSASNQQLISDLEFRQRMDQPLLSKVREAQRHRSGFDPLKMFNDNEPSATDLERYFNLDNSTKMRARTKAEHFKSVKKPAPKNVFTSDVATATGAVSFARTGLLAEKGSPVSPSNPDSFFSQLFSTDEMAWRNAIEQESEQLEGNILDEHSFQTLLDYIRRSQKDFVQQDWVELIQPWLSAEQLHRLYQSSRLLERLNEQLNNQAELAREQKPTPKTKSKKKTTRRKPETMPD